MRVIDQLLNAGIERSLDDYSSIKEKRIFNTFLLGSVLIIIPLILVNLLSGEIVNCAIGTGAILFIFFLYLVAKKGYFQFSKHLYIYGCMAGICLACIYNYSQSRFNGVENLMFPMLLASALLFRTKQNIIQTIVIIFSLVIHYIIRRKFEDLPFNNDFAIHLVIAIMIALGIFILTQIYRFNEKILLRKITKQQDILYALIDNVPVMMSLIDQDKKFQMVNKPYADFLKLKREEIIGAKCEDIIPEQIVKKHKDWFDLAVDGKAVSFNDDVDIKHNKYSFTGKYVPIKDSKGEIEFISQHLVDISELKLIEASLKEANQAKNKLLSMIAHDIRSPLAMLSSTLELDQKKELSDEEFVYLKNSINDKLHNLIHSLNTLLDWARYQTDGLKSRKSLLDLSELLTECVDLHQDFAELKEVKIELESNIDQQVLTDPNHLRLVVRNLIHNAVKFSSKSSKVSVTTEEIEDDVILTISDTGVGMTPEQVQSILSGNIQQSIQGTSGERGNGLGLSLSLGLLKLDGLDYSINSIKDKGTQIAIQIPLAAKVIDRQKA